MTREEILKELFSLQDVPYAELSARLSSDGQVISAR